MWIWKDSGRSLFPVRTIFVSNFYSLLVDNVTGRRQDFLSASGPVRDQLKETTDVFEKKITYENKVKSLVLICVEQELNLRTPARRDPKSRSFDRTRKSTLVMIRRG